MLKNIYLKLLIILAILSALVAGSFLLYDFLKVQERFPQKTLIGSVNVSGLTAQEAINLLNKSRISDLYPGSIIFEDTNETFIFSPTDLGVYVKSPETVARAFDLSHEGNYFQNLSERLRGKHRVFPGSFSFVPEQALELVQEIAQQTNSPSVDAKIELNEKTGGYHIFPDKPGRKLKISETIENFKKTLEDGGNNVKLEIEYFSQPKITEEMLRADPPIHKLSAYTTYYGSHDSPNRIHNIKLVASWINNTLMMPDEVLSLTLKIGDFAVERGFKEAYVILNSELVPQLGGGACQIGTTLYNAVALADLDILSRRNHSFYFNIYPLGRDATIYPGSADFKFKNNTGHPLLIKVVADNKKLSFRIYGTPTGKKVKFSAPAIYSWSPLDSTFTPSTLRKVIASDAPFRTILTRTVYNSSNEVIKTETIRSYYKLYGERSNVPIKRREPR